MSFYPLNILNADFVSGHNVLSVRVFWRVWINGSVGKVLAAQARGSEF